MNQPEERVTHEYLIFELGGRRFGLPAASVREIVRIVSIAPLPGAPPAVEGVINVRGRVVPVLDLRRRFALTAKSPEITDHLIIAGVGTHLTALRVDCAIGLMRVGDENLEDVTGFTSVGPGIRHIAKVVDELILIPDGLHHLLSESESRLLEAARMEPLEATEGATS